MKYLRKIAAWFKLPRHETEAEYWERQNGEAW